MYEIYGYPYGNQDAELLIYQPGNKNGMVLSPKLTREVSKGGSLTFTMTREHPMYEMLQKMSTVVVVKQDGKETWRGRIFSHEADWYNNRAVYCEGALSFFNDSCVTPFNYEGTLKQFLQHLIDVHNAQVGQKMKMFELGTVTAALGDQVVHFGDADQYGVGEDYGKVWDIIDKLVLKVFGGYAYCTFDAATGYNVLNYCDQAVEEKRLTAQKIEYGVNLLDLTEKTDTNDLYTRIYPVGNKHTVKETRWKYKFKWLPGGLGKYTDEHEERYGIMDTDSDTIRKYLPQSGYRYDLEDGYIENTDAVKKFGVIARIVEFDTDSANDTFAAGVQALQQNHLMVTSYTIKAVDLVDAGEATDRLTFACYAHILSAPHSVDAVMLCSKLTEPLDHPEKKEYSFGMTRRTLTDRHVENLGKTNLLDESNAASEKYAENLLNQLFAYKRDTNAKLGDISSNLTAAVKKMGDLQDQIDDNITSWFYEGVPTASNAPAKDWTTDTAKKQHVGDLYYDKKTGLGYRWVADGSAYTWTLIRDTGVAKALADAAAAQSAADSKVRCFVSTPTPPYDRGDIWMQGDSGDILRCQTFKYAGESFAAADWVKASKYTDDTLAKTVEGNLADAAKKISSLQTQMDGKVETWYYNGEPTTSNAPASSWKDDATRKLHIGDLYYNLSNGRCYHWTQNGSGWRWELVRDSDIQEALTAAARAQSAADGKIRNFIKTPTPPYDVGDIWMCSEDCEISNVDGGAAHAVRFFAGEIYRACVSRAEGETDGKDWMLASKYTDDTAANAAQNTANQAKNDAAEAAKTATNFLEFNQTDGLIVRHESLPGKRVQITNDGVKVLNNSSMVNIKSDSISITDGNGSCTINSGQITFHGIRNTKIADITDAGTQSYGGVWFGFDLSNYSSIILTYESYTDDSWWSRDGATGYVSVVLPVNGEKFTIAMPWNTPHFRTVRVQKNGIQFDGGWQRKSNYNLGLIKSFDLETPWTAGWKANDCVCVPKSIYGLM